MYSVVEVVVPGSELLPCVRKREEAGVVPWGGGQNSHPT